MTSPFIVKEHVVPGQHIREYARATANAQEEVLELAVKEYVPRDTGGDGDVTIIGAHANGFPKVLSLFALRSSSSAMGLSHMRGPWTMSLKRHVSEPELFLAVG